MKYLLLISLLIFTAYNLYVYSLVGILKSVSASYYFIKSKPLFTFVLWGFALPVIIAGDSVWFFLAGAGICFVGAAPNYKMKLEGDVHYAAALSGIVFGLIGLVDKGLWYVALPTALLIVAINWIKNHTYWQELIAFYVIVITLLIIK
jgi:hypothetical protein